MMLSPRLHPKQRLQLIDRGVGNYNLPEISNGLIQVWFHLDGLEYLIVIHTFQFVFWYIWDISVIEPIYAFLLIFYCQKLLDLSKIFSLDQILHDILHEKIKHVFLAEERSHVYLTRS